METICRPLNEELTILVCSCDGYADLWEPFFKLLQRYWGSEPMPRILLNTESKSFAYGDLPIQCLQLYAPGEAVDYGKRMLAHLARIETPYTLLMLDDFFLRRPVDMDRMKQIVAAMKAHLEIAAVYFDKSRYAEPEDGLIPGFARIAKYAMFKLNMQAAVWRTDKLKSYWQEGDDPWKWEVFVTYTAFDTEDVFYSIDEWEHAPIYYGYRPEGMGVFRGKWVIEDVAPLFEANNIKVDYQLRGIYSRDTAKSTFENVPQAMAFMLRRTKFRYFVGFSVFNVYKRLCQKLNRTPRYGNHIDYLYAKEQKQARAKGMGRE